MIKINYVNQYDQKKSYRSIIQKVLKTAYKVLKMREKTIVSVVLVNDETIREFNRSYREIDKPTDVLSFENRDDLYEIGDIFISLETTQRQAEALEHPFEYELIYLVIHGFLHCLGYDHIDDQDALVMDEVQKRIITQTKYKEYL